MGRAMTTGHVELLVFTSTSTRTTSTMALSKPTFLTHLKTLAKLHHHPPSPPPFITLRFLSFATPEEAAAERRRRKRRQRIEPPLNALRHNQPTSQRSPPRPIPRPNSNPNVPKIPEHVSVLTGKRLDLHNRILTLIRQNDLQEAALLARHSIYSNCKPTIFTCNAVMAAQIRQSKYADFLQLHRFVNQAGVAPNVVTHNLFLTAYCDCRKAETAYEEFKQLFKVAPFDPSPSTYKILVKGLASNGKIDKAIEIKDEMIHVKELAADPTVYTYIMYALANKDDSADQVLGLYEELKEKLGRNDVKDGIVSGSLIMAYFQKGMEKEAMRCYEEVLCVPPCTRIEVENWSGKSMVPAGYNMALEALIKYGKFEEALRLFDKMCEAHLPPKTVTLNVGSFNVVINGYCEVGRFKEAIQVFKNMGERNCSPDAASMNNLIEQLCNNGLVAEAEELFQEVMVAGKGPIPDEFTYVLLMDACFGQDRAEDAAGYFGEMVELPELKPNLVAYNKVVNGLIKAGKIDEAMEIFDQMAVKLKLEPSNYENLLTALFEAGGKLDEVLKIVGYMYDDEAWDSFSSEKKELVIDALKKEGREEELDKLLQEKDDAKKACEKEEELAAAKTTRGAISATTTTLFSTQGLISNKDGDVPTTDQQETGESPSPAAVGAVEEAVAESPSPADVGVGEEADIGAAEEANTSDDLAKPIKTGDEGTTN